METIILLLKEAVKQYQSGTVEVADNMLYTASKLRTETRKAEKLTPDTKPGKTT